MSRLLRAALCSITVAPIAFAQSAKSSAAPKSAAAQVMAGVGIQADVEWLRNILRQTYAQHPRAMLDAIADSLTARAIDPAAVRTDSDAYPRAVNAVLALWNAGMSRGRSGRPYAGTFERLVRVHREAASLHVRRRALAGMVVTNHARGLDYMRRVAESNDPTAVDAVELLTIDANGASLAAITPTAAERQASALALKALASRGRVKHNQAAVTLAFWIAQHQ